MTEQKKGRGIFEVRLEALRDKQQIPNEMLELLSRVHALQSEARELAEVILPDVAGLPGYDQRVQGAPLIDQAKFPYDAAQARRLFGALLELLHRQAQPLANAAKVIEKALADSSLNLDVAFQHYLEGGGAFFEEWGAKTPEAPGTISFLIQSSITPSLAAAAEKLGELSPPPNAWEHGHCPTCGGIPLIGELRGKEGQRFMTCSFCQTSYRTRRLMCVFCGESDTNKLATFNAPELPGFRVDVCKTCHCYIKATDYRELDKKPFALLDDLESLGLDVLAQKEGYKRPTLSGWGF